MPGFSVLNFLRGKDGRRAPSSFEKMADAYAGRIAAWRALPSAPPTGSRVGVLVTPWLGSAVPLYNLECSLALARTGSHVTVLRDASDIFDNAPHQSVIKALDRLLAALPPSMEVLDVARSPQIEDEADSAAAEKILRENAIWKLRGEEQAEKYLPGQVHRVTQAAAHLGRIRHLLKTQRLDWLLIPGGIWGISAIYAEVARQLGVGITTYDSDPGILLVAHDGAAAHHADLPRSFARLNAELESLPLKKNALVDLANGELARRAAGRDDFGFQTVAATAATIDAGSVFVPLNLRWDSAALARGRLFGSVAEWLGALLRWAEQRPDARLCIRQHPSERHTEARGSDDVAAIWKDSPARDRVTYVQAADPVNTYDLLPAARVVLPYTSTLGIEATMLGLPAITSTNCYYADLGFVWNPATIEEYFARLDEAVDGQLKVTPEARRQAAVAYAIGQQWGHMRTFFTPTPADFPKWTALPPEELWQMGENADLHEAMSTRTPLSYLRYRRLWRDAATATP